MTELLVQNIEHFSAGKRASHPCKLTRPEEGGGLIYSGLVEAREHPQAQEKRRADQQGDAGGHRERSICVGVRAIEGTDACRGTTLGIIRVPQNTVWLIARTRGRPPWTAARQRLQAKAEEQRSSQADREPGGRAKSVRTDDMVRRD